MNKYEIQFDDRIEAIKDFIDKVDERHAESDYEEVVELLEEYKRSLFADIEDMYMIAKVLRDGDVSKDE